MAQQNYLGKVATKIHKTEHLTVVFYHLTPVVMYDKRKIVLNYGGWKTPTTKTRMNQASNQFGLGYRVYQKDYDWFVSYKDKTYRFKTEELIIKR